MLPEMRTTSFAAVLSRFALAFWVGATIYLSLAPGLPLPHVAGSDKLSHLLAYSLNGILVVCSSPSKTSLGLGVGAIAALGVLLEAIQAYLPSRYFSVVDIGANLGGLALGVSLGLVAGAVFFGRQRGGPSARS